MNFIATRSVIWAAKAAMLLSLFGVLVAISQSSLMVVDDLIPTALAIDFLITLPIAYFFLIRKTVVPKFTVIPVFVASFSIASLLLPEGVAVMAFAAVVILPAVEVIFLGYLGFRVYRTRKTFLEDREAGNDFMEGLREAVVREVWPPAAARAVAFEIAMLSYVFLIWTRRPAPSEFTYHRRSSPALVLFVLIFLLIVETIGLHLLLAEWSSIAAWIATGFSVYLAVQLIAHLKALRLRPIVVTESNLMLRCGILGDCRIPRDTITSAELVTGGDEPSAVDLLPLGGMSQPNVRVVLSEPTTVFGFYGLRRETTAIRLSVDDPDTFITKIGRGKPADDLD